MQKCDFCEIRPRRLSVQCGVVRSEGAGVDVVAAGEGTRFRIFPYVEMYFLLKKYSKTPLKFF